MNNRNYTILAIIFMVTITIAGIAQEYFKYKTEASRCVSVEARSKE